MQSAHVEVADVEAERAAASTNGNGAVDPATGEQLAAALDLMATVKRILGQ
jgi:hypothetical protein